MAAAGSPVTYVPGTEVPESAPNRGEPPVRAQFGAQFRAQFGAQFGAEELWRLQSTR
ncbi:hypothetical protein [Streptomyces sp. NPDC001070]